MQPIAFWRVCRVLANRHRLRMLGLISHRPGLRVSEIARAMTLSRPAASQYLRALEACGFVVAHRRASAVIYGLREGRAADASTRRLTDALIPQLGVKNAIEGTFKVATAFANPGRIDVFKSLKAGSKSVAELRAATGFPEMTLWRHLQKLENRGFVRYRPQTKAYEAATLKSEFARALAETVH